MDLREVLGHRPCEALFMLFPLQQEFCPLSALPKALLFIVLVVLVCFPLSVSNTPSEWRHSAERYCGGEQCRITVRTTVPQIINDRLMSD